jgi:hypothetical protein
MKLYSDFGVRRAKNLHVCGVNLRPRRQPANPVWMHVERRRFWLTTKLNQGKINLAPDNLAITIDQLSIEINRSNPQTSSNVIPALASDLMEPIRTAIEGHWRASEEGNIEAEHSVYAEDAILDYPQSGERFRGRSTISAQRGGHPAERHFTVLRISGNGSLWVSECIITYNGKPSFSVSIMEFEGELVKHETQYFTEAFAAPASRAKLAESMPDRHTEMV